MKTIVGTTFAIEGLENIPTTGCIFAPKHQSFWDTYALLPSLNDPVYILKRELMWIPLFGRYAAKQRMIPVNLAARGKVMLKVMERAKEEIANGRELIIYPEGPRLPPGAEPQYRYGVARLCRDLKVPVVPVSMHPGLFWPRRSTMRYPAISRCAFCHLSNRALIRMCFSRLVELTERASDELLIETATNNPHLPLPTAVERLEELKGHKA